jgi:hypothetical protein
MGCSVIKAIGATGWLLTVLRPDYVVDWVALRELLGADPTAVGFGVLALALFVEHVVAVDYSLTQ